MRKQIALLAVIVAGAACGGGGGKGENPAVARTFNYNTPGQVSSSATAAVSQSLASAASFDTAAGPDVAMNVNGSLFEAANEALGGGSFFGIAEVDEAPALRSLRTRALGLVTPIGDASGTLQPPGCITLDPAAKKITYRGCTITESSVDMTTTVTIDGTITGATGSVTWDLRLGIHGAATGITLDAAYTESGTFAVTATTAKAHQQLAFSVTARGNGQSATLAMAQAVDLDVTHAPVSACATRITGGTFEAKRVWTAVPSELRNDPVDGPNYRDRGVKITWAPNTCGQATVLFSAQ
jgi:hypothetical protein